MRQTTQRKQKVTHSVLIVKDAKKSLNIEKMKGQIKKIQERIINPTRERRGWSLKTDARNYIPRQKDAVTYQYSVVFTITCEPPRDRGEESIQTEFDGIVKFISEAGRGNDWHVSLIDGEPVQKDDDRIPQEVGYAHVEIPHDFYDHFDVLFDRGDQIARVVAALEAAISTNFADRFNTVLVGDPAGGKSQLLRCLKSALGDNAVLEYDATATTAAGAIKDITSREELPRILIVEEIEKVDDDDGKSLRWLLGVLDDRAEIRKVTAREASNVQRSVRMLCFATVNNYDKFCRMMSGALASRFPNEVYCPSPDRALLEKILKRDVLRAKGDLAWIAPTLDYCEHKGITDPRRVKSICLCGRNRLLTGDYQNILDRTDAATFHARLSGQK